jgi:hemolysin activation/secretion protein
MRKLSGLTFAATTTRDPESPDQYRLGLDTRFDRVGGAIRLSNRGTDEIGPNFLMGQVMTHGLLGGRADLGILFGAATDYDEYHGLGLSGSIAAGNGGIRAQASAFRSRSDPLESGQDRDDRYLRERLTLGARGPINESSVGSLHWSAGLRFDDLSILRSGTELRREKLRMVELGLQRRRRSGSDTQYLYSFDISYGLDGFGSEIIAHDLTEDPRRTDFAVLRTSTTWVRRLSDRWTARVDGFGQLTSDVLAYLERFKIGGDRLGRGFEVTEIAGDQGVGAKAEIRRRLPRASATFGRPSVYAVYDIGAVWKNDLPGRDSAASGGIGFATEFRNATAQIEFAKPLTGPDIEGKNDLSMFIEVSVKL